MKKSLSQLLALFLLTSCALTPPARMGEDLVAEDNLEESIKRLTQAIQKEPNEMQYRALLFRTIDKFVAEQIQAGQKALQAGEPDQAETHFTKALTYDSQNPQARAGMKAAANVRSNQAQIDQAQQAIDQNAPEEARNMLRSILAKEPDNQRARQMLTETEHQLGKHPQIDDPRLAETFRKPVSLQFKNASLRNVIDAISRQTGLNFIVDSDVEKNLQVTIFAKSTPLADALDIIFASNGLTKKILNDNTVLIYPNDPVKQNDYQDMIVKSFFLANANAKEIMNLIRSIAKVNDIHIDERLNIVTVRAPIEKIRLSEKLVQMSDQADAEVMLQVEIMEISGSKLQELGLLFPNQISVLTPPVDANGRSDILTLDGLDSLTSSDFGISPNPVLNFLRTDGDINVLANPRIRVKNKEKARIHIGDKLPVITTNLTSTGVASESVNYLDVGLKFDVEPLVHLEGDVAMKVNLEVSNITDTIRTTNGSLVYQLGSRNATTNLRLRDGETQVLAGLISDAERSSASRLPGLGQLPLVGRLFGSTREEASKNEIVLLITPTIIRNLTRPDLNQSEYFGGTGNVTSDKPLRLRPARQISRPARTAPIIESNTEPAVNEEADAAIEAPASGSGAPSENQPAPENNPAPAATLRPGVQQKPRGLFEPPLEVAAEANKKALAN
jgi:general secretion pathway protein D